MKTSESDLTKGDITKHIKNLAIPASIGFFFQTMYNIVDTFYAGQISTDALAAMTLSFPVFFIILAISVGFNQGISVLVANYFGENNIKKFQNIALQGISFGFIISIIITIVGLITAPLIFQLLNASGTYLQLALDYTNVLFYGSIMFVFVNILGGILTAIGDTKTLRNVLIIGFFLNLILDPLFLYGLNLFSIQIIPAMGISGIALATIVTQTIGLIYIINKVRKTHIFECDWLKNLKPNFKKYLEIIKQGLPASLNMATVALGIFVINYYISLFSKEAIAAYGITTRIVQIALLPVMGLNIATMALVGQNNGAKLLERVKEIIFKVVKYGIVIITFTSIIVFLIKDYLIKIFIDNSENSNEILQIAIYSLNIELLASIGYILLFICVAAMQALKKPMFGLYLGIARQFIIPFLLIPVFIYTFDLGLYGIFWAIFTTVWASALFAVYYLYRTVKKLNY